MAARARACALWCERASLSCDVLVFARIAAQKEVVTFRWYRQRPGGLGVLCSDGCNQCRDA